MNKNPENKRYEQNNNYTLQQQQTVATSSSSSSYSPSMATRKRINESFLFMEAIFIALFKSFFQIILKSLEKNNRHEDERKQVSIREEIEQVAILFQYCKDNH